MSETLGRNRNTNDAAFIPALIELNTNTTTKLVDSKERRIFFCISNPALTGVWLKLQRADVDNDKKGIFIPANGYWEMPTDNIYTGEISAIGDRAGVDVYITEY